MRIANSYRFGRHTEKPEAINEQLSFLMRQMTYTAIGRQNLLRRKPLSPILFQKKNWMPFTAWATGSECRIRPTKGCAMNRSHGLWRSIPSRSMWVQNKEPAARQYCDTFPAVFHLKCEVCEFCTAIPHRTGILPQRRQSFQTDHDEREHPDRP